MLAGPSVTIPTGGVNCLTAASLAGLLGERALFFADWRLFRWVCPAGEVSLGAYSGDGALESMRSRITDASDACAALCSASLSDESLNASVRGGSLDGVC